MDARTRHEIDAVHERCDKYNKRLSDAEAERREESDYVYKLEGRVDVLEKRLDNLLNALEIINDKLN